MYQNKLQLTDVKMHWIERQYFVFWNSVLFEENESE